MGEGEEKGFQCHLFVPCLEGTETLMLSVTRALRQASPLLFFLASPSSPSLPPNITRAKVLVRLPAWEEGVRVTLGYLFKVQGTLQR